MNSVISGHTFAARLKEYGIEIPDNTTKISITVTRDNLHEDVAIVFHKSTIGDPKITKSKTSIDKFTGSDLHYFLKNMFKLPNDITKIHLEAEIDKVAALSIELGVPKQILDFVECQTLY